MKTKTSSILLSLIIVLSLVILFLLFTTQEYLKHGVVMNLTNKDIPSKITISLKNGCKKDIYGILSHDAVTFSKIDWFITREIESVVLNEGVPITDFSKPIQLGDGVSLNFLRRDTNSELYGMCFHSSDAPILNKTVCINFSKWVLPVIGIIRESHDYEPFISFPFNRDISVYTLKNPQTIKKFAIIDLYNIIGESAIEQNPEGPAGPNAVVGIEIGDSFIRTLLSYIFEMFMLLLVFLSIVNCILIIFLR